MAQFYTLEEAAIRLGITNDEFRRRLKDEWKTLRSLRDGSTLRFRSSDIDELSRSMGEQSEPELQLSDLTAPSLNDSSDEMLILDPEPKKPKSGPKSPAKKAAEEPLMLDDSDETIFTVPSGDSGVGKKKPKRGDSDIRLDVTPEDQDATGDLPLDLDLSAGPRSGILKAPSSGKLSSPSKGRLQSPGSAKIPGPKSSTPADDGSSEFELSLDESSDSFELTLNTDSSEEVDIGGAIASDDRGGQSGIDLGRPSDSGVSLEKKGGKSKPKRGEDSSEFELSLDPPSGKNKNGSGKIKDQFDSEFELSLEDSGELVQDSGEEAGGDIFETDFELPAVAGDDSASEVIAVDPDTDLELSDEVVEQADDHEIVIDEADAPIEDESASQVMLMDDEEVITDEEGFIVDSAEGGSEFAMDEDDGSISSALTGVRPDADADDVPIRTVVAKPPKWGVVPLIFLMPSMFVLLLGTLMTFELIRGMWGYQQPVRMSDSLLRGVADTFGMQVKD